MRRLSTALACALLLALFPITSALAQEAGDYQSAASGAWNEPATWAIYDGAAWTPATTAPDGSETITITADHTVTANVAVTVSGTVTVEGEGQLTVDGGSLAFAEGGTYDHARDGGSVPIAEWGTGSTFALTGTVGSAPGNRNQDFHHVILNTPQMIANRDLGLNDVTIGGDIRVISTGSARWQLSSAPAEGVRQFTIMGDVVVEAGQFAVQGTGNAFTVFEVHHYGDVVVTGGNFSLARGSQGSGTGSTTWYMHEGDFTMENATTQNSNPEPGQAQVVFTADGTQRLAFHDVSQSSFHFEVAETTTLEISDGFDVSGLVTNRGAIAPLGTLTFTGGTWYDHARNGGDVPTAVWAEGSIAMFTGITTDAPGSRGQDYHHLVLNTPDLVANRDLSLNGNTIGGDIHVVNTGSGRWHLVGGSSGVVTIMGDVIVEAGQFATQGTSSQTEVVVDHYGDVIVTGGNFAIARGSQGGEGGEGSTRWYLHEGNFSMSNATTQNSNPWRATFVFAGEGEQYLDLDDVNYAGGGLPVTVAAGATLNVIGEPIGGNGAFIVEDEGTLATGHPEGIDGALDTTGPVTFAPRASLLFSGAEAQVFGTRMPASVGVLTIANPHGVTASDTTSAYTLLVAQDAMLIIEPTGSLSVEDGHVQGHVVNQGELVAATALSFGAVATYEHARNGGSLPSGTWGAGSTLLITGAVDSAPGNRNQSFHHITFNSPDQLSNLNMGFNDVTIGGDIRVINTGAARWYLTSASAEGSAQVTLQGDVIVEGGQFSVHGTGNAFTTFIVDHYGDIHVTGGNFSIARGSQGGTGTTTWILHEGDFRMSGARSQNSNPGNAMFVFAGEEVQHLALGEGNQIDHLPIEVREGTTLDLGESVIEGSDLFTLQAGATLATAHADGVAGAIQATGDVTLDEGASFVFNGTEAQVTSELMPVVVRDLVINNEAGVTLSQETTITGVLRLQAGVFDNTIPFTLAEGATISFEGGSLILPVSAEDGANPVTEFQLHQNYPNPVHLTTTIRYDVSESVHVSIRVFDVAGRQVSTLVDELHSAGSYSVEWEGSGLASGVYLYQINAGAYSEVRRMTLLK